MRCVHGTEWNFCWECRALKAEKLLDELRHEMVPLAEAFYLRDVRGQIELLHDQIASQNAEIERLRAALKPFSKLFLYPDDLGFEAAEDIRADQDWDEDANDVQIEAVFVLRRDIRRARAELEAKDE